MSWIWYYATIMAAVVIAVVAMAVSDRKKTEEQKQREWEQAKKRAEQERLSRTIVEVKLLGGGSTKYKRGGLGGAAFGGFIGGAPGAIVGAVLPGGKGVQKQRFAVKYGDGHVEIQEWEIGSGTYKKLMQYVKWEEIQ